jgi:hypothetical protein
LLSLRQPEVFECDRSCAHGTPGVRVAVQDLYRRLESVKLAGGKQLLEQL